MTSLVFTTGTDLLSKAIRWFTKSKTSHVALGTDLSGVPVLIHATVGGVQVAHRRKWLKPRVLVAEYTINAAISIHAAVEHLGERYDYVGLSGFAPVLIARWFGRKIKNPFASPRATVCSELVLRADTQHSVAEWRGLDPERTSPADLLLICEHSSTFRRVDT